MKISNFLIEEKHYKNEDILQRYVDHGYSINSKLRNDEGSSHSYVLDNEMRKHKTKEPMVVHRYIDSDFHNEHMKILPIGSIFHDKGYVSTTLDPENKFFKNYFGTRNKLIKIHLPKDHPHIPIHSLGLNGYASEEQEMLLPRGSKFIKKDDNTYEALPHKVEKPKGTLKQHLDNSDEPKEWLHYKMKHHLSKIIKGHNNYKSEALHVTPYKEHLEAVLKDPKSHKLYKEIAASRLKDFK